MASLSRRDFLRAGGIVVLGTAAAACGKGGSSNGGRKTLDQVIHGRQQSVQRDIFEEQQAEAMAAQAAPPAVPPARHRSQKRPASV